MPSTMRGARSNALETNSNSWPSSSRRSRSTNRFPWGAALAAVIAFSKAFESTLNRSASPTWTVSGTAARRLAVMPFLLISELNDESAMFTVSLAQKRRTAVRSPASQSSSMRLSASSVWGQQSAGHALAHAALAGHHADDLLDAAVRVGGVVLGRCIAGRTGCTAIGAVMGAFFAHSLCRARQGQDPGCALPPCSICGQGRALPDHC